MESYRTNWGKGKKGNVRKETRECREADLAQSIKYQQKVKHRNPSSHQNVSGTFSLALHYEVDVADSVEQPVLFLRRCLHLSCAKCPFLAVVRVNSAPQFGHIALVACPDLSR